MTRSSYSNQIPREQSPGGRAGSPGDRDSLHRHKRGESGADKRAPRRLGGGERESARAGHRRGHRRGTVVGGPRREEATARHALAARTAAGAVTPYPGPDHDPQPSRTRRCCARAGGAHFPKFGELTQVAATSSGSTALSPGNPTWSPAAWLQPEPSAPGDGGAEGAGWTVRVGSTAAEPHGTCSPLQWPAVWRAGQNGGNCRPSAARRLAPYSANLGMRRLRPVHCT